MPQGAGIIYPLVCVEFLSCLLMSPETGKFVPIEG